MLIFLGCEEIAYSPKKENYHDIVPANNYLDFNFTNQRDTLYAWGKMKFYLVTKTNGKKFFKYKYYIIDVDSGKSDLEDCIELNTLDYPDGTYRFRVEMWANTCSGSLADNMNAEYLVRTKEYLLMIDNAVPTYFHWINSFKENNGRLEIGWQPYNHCNLTKFTIRKYQFMTIPEMTQSIVLAIIRDYKINTWIDSFYIGGDLRYEVDIEANGITKGGAGSVFYSPLPDINYIKFNDDTTVTIKWSKCLWYSNFQFYKVQRAINVYPYEFEDIKVSTNILDTTFIDHKIDYGSIQIYRIITGNKYSKNTLIQCWK